MKHQWKTMTNNLKNNEEPLKNNEKQRKTIKNAQNLKNVRAVLCEKMTNKPFSMGQSAVLVGYA